MSKSVTEALYTVWGYLQQSSWYGGLDLEADSGNLDFRRRYVGEVTITYGDAADLIEKALRGGTNDPKLVTAFGEGVRGSSAYPEENVLVSVETLMLLCGWAFNPDAAVFYGRSLSFGALAEEGIQPDYTNGEECEAAFRALLFVAYALNGLSLRVDTSNPVDPSPELPIPLGDVGEEYPGGGGGGGGDAMILEFTFPPEEVYPYLLQLPIYHDPLGGIPWDNEYTITVDWGDESEPEEFAYTDEQTPPSSVTHSYAAAGVYEVSITGVLPIFGIPGMA